MGKCRMLDRCGNIWIAFIIYCRYIELYSYRFTKGDHIELVRLMYQCLFEEYFDEDIIKICARTLTNLLRLMCLFTDFSHYVTEISQVFIETVPYRRLLFLPCRILDVLLIVPF